MKEKSLFEAGKETVEKIFKSEDVFFNNGIVNLYQFLKDRNFELGVQLNQNELVLKINPQRQDDIYNQILNTFLKDESIVTFNDKNKRIFFDINLNKFVQREKVNIKGGGSNDSKNSLIRVHIGNLNISKDELKQQEEIYLNSFDNTNKDEFSISKCYYDKTKQEIYVLSTLEEHIQKYTNFLIKGNNLALNSSIHTFEDGQSYFHDMLVNEKIVNINGEKIKAIKTIDKWNALIYWFGSRIKRFYNYSYFIYPNSSNLEDLNKFKEFLKIDDDKKEYRDEKGNIISTSSNIYFFEVLSKDGIINKHFYISKSEEEFEVKFFMYLFSIIYHIEEQYEKVNERRKESRKELFETLKYLSFVIYTDDGTFKTSLNEYTRAYLLIKFFQQLKEHNLFKYLSDIFSAFSQSQKKDEVNLNLKCWCQKLLNFSNLRKEYYLTSFNILKNNSKGFGKVLFEFETSYLNYILGGKDMSIHENSKIIGDGIGHFCAELGDKDLLFKLRNVKNYKQMVSYFKDLKFSSLKNEKEARFSKEFNDSLEAILETVEQDWEIARDYIAIYAIDKFKTTDFAQNHNNN